MTRVLDCFPYNGELVAAFRVAYLYNVVDEFIIIEARETHSGNIKKQLQFEKNRADFERYMDKITYLVIESFPKPDSVWMNKVPQRFSHWMSENAYSSWWREMYQREYGERYIYNTYIAKEDTTITNKSAFVVHCSDADEIPSKDAIIFSRNMYPHFSEVPIYLEMDFYYYNFRWSKKQKWYYAFIVNDQYLRNAFNVTAVISCFNEARIGSQRDRIIPNAGWHCSYFASKDDLRRKLESFAHRECDKDEYKTDEFLHACISKGKDIAGRGQDEDCNYQFDTYKLPQGWDMLQKELERIQSDVNH